MNPRLKMRLYLAACVACIYALPAILLFFAFFVRPTSVIGVYGLMTLPALAIWVITERYYDAELNELIAILKKSTKNTKTAIENIETAIQAAKEAIDIAREAQEMGGSLVETVNKSLDEVTRAINSVEQAAADVQEQLPNEPRGRGRPSKVITFPGAGWIGIRKPITDPETMTYLIRLQEAKERGELAQALSENPHGGPAIPYTTANNWLDKYQDEISAARITRN